MADDLRVDPTPLRAVTTSIKPRQAAATIEATLDTSLTFTAARDMIDAARPVEIIEGVAWAGCLSVLVSESGAGKTFLLLSAAAAVSSDIVWHGRAVQHGSVAYLSYEGDALGLRLRALRDVSGHQLDNVYLVRAHDPLSPRVSRDGEERSIGELTVVSALETLAAELQAAGRPPIVLLVVDTVRASLSGSEDSSEHVAAYIRAVRRIMTHVSSAAAILAHHAGWQDGESQKKRERGSSAWRGNCDATLYLEAGEYQAETGEARLILRALKVRDTERPALLHLIRRRVDLLETDRYGQPVTSCVIEHDGRSYADREAEKAEAANAAQRQTDLAVLRVIRDHTITSKSSLREHLGKGQTAAAETVARLLSAGWIVKSTQREPYRLTDTGTAALSEAV